MKNKIESGKEIIAIIIAIITMVAMIIGIKILKESIIAEEKEGVVIECQER